MRAGQLLLFDERLFHCSPPNRSASRRIAVAAVLAPRDSTMRYYHALGDGRAEVFEVADDFCIRHSLFRAAPDGEKSIGVVTPEVEALTEEKLLALCSR